MKTIFRALLLAGIFTLPSFAIASVSLNRDRSIDVQDYGISIRFDRSERVLFGDTVITFKALRDNFQELELDSVGIRYSNVTLGDTDVSLPFRTTPTKIFVQLPRQMRKGEELRVRLRYSATRPKMGVYFVERGNFLFEGTQRENSAQIWTQGQPEEARHWLPSYDFPDDKATTSISIRTIGNETAISNGRYIGAIPNIDGSVTRSFRMDLPHPTYLISFVVGEFSRSDLRFREIPLSIYRYPSAPNAGQAIFEKTPQMLDVFERLLGVSYPFNKYDQVIVSKFVAGGMENITATTLSDDSIHKAVTPAASFAAEDLLVHEVAHSWFGNLVTARNWAELWLNEGFATFLEAAYREQIYGAAQYRFKIETDAASYMLAEKRMKDKRGLFNRRARGDDSIFDQVTYQKGGVVIHMLRRTIGEDHFWKALNLLLKTHQFGNIETKDLRKAIEEVSGRDMGWFFDQWVYGSGYPVLTLNQTRNVSENKLTLSFTQRRTGNRLQPETFRLRFKVRTLNDDGSHEDHDVYLRRRFESVTIKTKPNFKELVIDPDYDVPLIEFTKR